MTGKYGQKILDHDLWHHEIDTLDRVIFLVVGVVVTLAVFYVREVLSL
jgi:hypothetical protein